MHNNTTQQYPDTPEHKQTQYPVHKNTEQNTRYNIYAAHRTAHTRR